jgi:hypothetical protein
MSGHIDEVLSPQLSTFPLAATSVTGMFVVTILILPR